MSSSARVQYLRKPRSRRSSTSWHLYPSTPVNVATRRAFANSQHGRRRCDTPRLLVGDLPLNCHVDCGFALIGGPRTPLFEEECDIVAGALVSNSAKPVGMHWSSALPRLTASDYPCRYRKDQGWEGARAVVQPI